MAKGIYLFSTGGGQKYWDRRAYHHATLPSEKEIAVTINRGASRRRKRIERYRHEISPIACLRFRIDLDPAEVKRCTGFADVYMLLGFSSIACNGDLDVMADTVLRNLAWFEKWFRYFELKWGKATYCAFVMQGRSTGMVAVSE